MGRTLDEALQHVMEAASEWAQAIPAPRPRLLEALRDDPDVKAALADGAVLAIVPLILEGGKPAKASISLDARTLQAIGEHGLTRSAFMALPCQRFANTLAGICA